MTFCFVYVKISLFLQYRKIVFDYEMILFRVSHSGEETWGVGAPSHLTNFLEPPLPKPMPPMGHPHPPLKNEAPTIWKTTPPLLKHETPFHDMIPRKSTIINNLKLVSAICYQIFIFSSSDRPSKIKKNVFYSIWKALFVLEVFKFL